MLPQLIITYSKYGTPISDFELEDKLNYELSLVKNCRIKSWDVSTENIINYIRLQIKKRGIFSKEAELITLDGVEIRFLYYNDIDVLCEAFCDKNGNLDHYFANINDDILSEIISWNLEK